jgi:RNA recognition motif-containing protein
MCISFVLHQSGNSDGKWSHDKFSGNSKSAAPARKSLETGGKISVSNLNWEVTQENLKELFAEFGEVRRAVIQYDRTGRSEGHGEVSFATKGAAEAAVKELNGVCLDFILLLFVCAISHGLYVLAGPVGRHVVEVGRHRLFWLIGLVRLVV